VEHAGSSSEVEPIYIIHVEDRQHKQAIWSENEDAVHEYSFGVICVYEQSRVQISSDHWKSQKKNGEHREEVVFVELNGHLGREGQADTQPTGRYQANYESTGVVSDLVFPEMFNERRVH